jgi:hypothetical protein
MIEIRDFKFARFEGFAICDMRRASILNVDILLSMYESGAYLNGHLKCSHLWQRESKNNSYPRSPKILSERVRRITKYFR